MFQRLVSGLLYVVEVCLLPDLLDGWFIIPVFSSVSSLLCVDSYVDRWDVSSIGEVLHWKVRCSLAVYCLWLPNSIYKMKSRLAKSTECTGEDNCPCGAWLTSRSYSRVENLRCGKLGAHGGAETWEADWLSYRFVDCMSLLSKNFHGWYSLQVSSFSWCSFSTNFLHWLLSHSTEMLLFYIHSHVLSATRRMKNLLGFEMCMVYILIPENWYPDGQRVVKGAWTRQAHINCLWEFQSMLDFQGDKFAMPYIPIKRILHQQSKSKSTLKPSIAAQLRVK